MRFATRVWLAVIAITAVNLSASAGGPSSADTPAPTGEKDQAQVWFEHALSLDIGAAGAPDAVQAFAAMRRGELGLHPSRIQCRGDAQQRPRRAPRRGASLDLVCARGRRRQPSSRLQSRAAL